MVSSLNRLCISLSLSSKSNIRVPQTSDYAPQPKKEKSHLHSMYCCATNDLAITSLIPFQEK